MKKTLVIHPTDESTTFLEVIYKDINNKTVIRSGATSHEIHEMIESHDRIIMCGHGTPNGLLSVGNWGSGIFGYVVGYKTMQYLKNRKDCYYIWCNADQYVHQYNLKGFFSGMFISEVEEANYFNVKTTEGDVQESNNAFVKILSNYIKRPIKQTFKKVIREYGVLSESNSVASYNHQRLYLKE